MNTESPRLRALLAAGAALVVFGITIPATAAPDNPNPNRPGVGTKGNVPDRIPPGQQVGLDEGLDSNRGYQCDGNKGAGAGNPAHGVCTTTPGDDGGYNTQPPPPPTGTTDPNPPTTGGGDTTPPAGGGTWSDNDS